MRDKELITNGSVCEGDFNGTATTAAEHAAEVHTSCRFFPHDCPVSRSPQSGPYCIPRAAHEIARYVIKDRTSVQSELDDFARMAPFPPKGFFDPTVEGLDDAVTDKPEIMNRIATHVNHILGVQVIDRGTLHKEYKVAATAELIAKYPVLAESVYDDTQSGWVHGCGALLVSADVIHQVRYRAMPLAGPGNVQHEAVPYCLHCQDEPSREGGVVYVEDLEQQEEAILRRMRQQDI